MFCYCGSDKSFDTCCRLIIEGKTPASHCEQLMRSRYSAYCIKDSEYLFRTYHLSKREENPIQDIKAFADSCHFLQLIMHSSEQSGNEGTVSFTFRYIQDNTLYEVSEVSRFLKTEQWFYLDGKVIEHPKRKLGRNDLCPCLSGKKFKQCIVHLTSGQRG